MIRIARIRGSNIEEINLPQLNFSATWGTGILAAIASFMINLVVE